jgi:predicted PurR-regulated permease PerM
VFRQLATLLLGVLVMVIVALPLSAAATQLQRIGVPRVVGAALALLLLLGAVGGLIAALVPVFSHEINGFTNSLPSIVDELRHRLGRLTGTSPSHVGQQVQHFIDGYTQHPAKLLGPLESIGASVVAAVAAIIVGLLTALYTAIHPEPLVSGVTRLVPPARRPQAEVVLARLRIAYLAWLRGLCIGMVLLGVLTYIGLVIVGLHFAAFFAIFTAVAIIVPYYGALLSSIPPILYALTISPGKALVVALIYIIAHQVEGNLVQPLVVARTVELHPAVVAVGVVAVDQLFGFIGLFVAVPILATGKILLEELWIKPHEQAVEPPDNESSTPITSTASRRTNVGAEEEEEDTPVRAAV